MACWSELRAWADGHRGDADVEIDRAMIGPPSPAPRQILGVGLNYESHAREAGFEIPEQPMIFTKLHASLAGPFDAIPISTAAVDWEVELVVIVGRRARHVPAAQAWDHVAGLTIGQDLSEREIQFRPLKTPRFSLGKSLLLAARRRARKPHPPARRDASRAGAGPGGGAGDGVRPDQALTAHRTTTQRGARSWPRAPRREAVRRAPPARTASPIRSCTTSTSRRREWPR